MRVETRIQMKGNGRRGCTEVGEGSSFCGGSGGQNLSRENRNKEETSGRADTLKKLGRCCAYARKDGNEKEENDAKLNLD